ncbi:hypothetical protein V6N13_016899 [Hibiscus sabdariffa]
MHIEGLTTSSFKGKGVNEVHCGVVEEPTDFKKSHSLEVEGELSDGKSKSEISPEVDFLNVGFNPKAYINERLLWDIVGFEGAGGVSGAVEHDYNPCVGKVNYFNFNMHVFQE